MKRLITCSGLLFLYASVAPANPCPFAEFKQYLNYKGESEVLWNLSTLEDLTAEQKNAIQTWGAFDYFKVLGAKGGFDCHTKRQLCLSEEN